MDRAERATLSQRMADTDDDAALETATVAIRRLAWDHGIAETGDDLVVREEPLELRIAGVPLAVLMRTPGHDLELARGFAITEGIVDHPSQILSVRHCDVVDRPEAEDNIVQIVVDPAHPVDLARFRRNMFASSSCGVCGKATLEQALRAAAPIAVAGTIRRDDVLAIPEALRRGQHVFARTGGLHGIGLFDADAQPLVVREDVGRHNALDKVVGWAAEHDRDPTGLRVLGVSGRVSFEIVQKALAARVPVIVAVSAPSSLAIDLAERAGITLIGFTRGRRACVYTHAARVG